MANFYYKLSSGNEDVPEVLAPNALCDGGGKGCSWQNNFERIDKIQCVGRYQIPYFRSLKGYLVFREDLFDMLPRKDVSSTFWVGDVVFGNQTGDGNFHEQSTKYKYYFLKAKRRSKVICRAKHGRVCFCKACKLPSIMEVSNLHLIQSDVSEQRPFYLAEMLRFLVHPDIANEIFKAKLKRICVDPIPVLPEPVDGLPANLFKLAQDFFNGKADLVPDAHGSFVANKEKTKAVVKRRKSDVKKAKHAISQLKKCLSLKSPAFELVYTKKPEREKHEGERMYAAISHHAPAAPKRKTPLFDDDFRKYHLAFSMLYENYDGLSLYKAEMDSRGVIEIAAFDEINSLADEFKKAASKDHMFSEVEELFDNSYVFADSESSYFLYCVDGHNAGHVVMVNPKDRWSETTVATSLEDFLVDLSTDPINLFQFCNMDLEYVAGRESFEAVGFIDDVRK